MARLFTAVEPGPVARAAIATRQSELARSLGGASGGGLRLVRAEQLHLTLVFIGDVHHTRMPAIVDALAAVVPVPAFDIELASCGVFPHHGPARVLWLGVARGAHELTQVFDIVSARLEEAGIPREPRPFTPHLTLGRWRGRGEPRGRLRLPQFGLVTSDRVSAVTLFESRLCAGGAEHTALIRAPLAAASSSLH